MKIKFIIIAIVLAINTILSQDITFIPRQTSISDTMGKELVFYIDLRNVSSTPQTVFIVRKINNIPSSWSSSICLDFCFPPNIDSVATTPTFGSSPLNPGETREVSLHVYTSANQPGQGNLRLAAGTFRNPNQIISVDFVANTFNPTSVEKEYSLIDFKLEQNYPNPFGKAILSDNSGTKIVWQTPMSGWQTIKLYDLLGREVETIVDGYYEAGVHSTSFIPNSTLPSGVYFYQLRAGNFIETRKMILER
jgi:hypothetical protein